MEREIRIPDFTLTVTWYCSLVPSRQTLAAIRRLALFNALLDLVDDEYQLSSKHTDNSVLLLT